MSTLQRLAVKYGLIFTAISLLINILVILASKTSMSQSAKGFLAGGVGATLIVAFIVCVATAHFKFNRANDSYISFGQAFQIGIIMIGLAAVVMTIFSLVTYPMVIGQIKESYSQFSGQYGIEPPTAIQMALKAFLGYIMYVLILLLVISMESMWKVYSKSGQPGVASIIPFYNIIVLLRIVGKPEWWFILLLIPFVNIIFLIWITNLLSIRFGKDEGFTIGLLLLPFIFYPILGFGSAKYVDLQNNPY